jgi:hypothetical protein
MVATNVGYFPRVPYWIDLATRRPVLMLNLWRIANVVWLTGGSVIFFILEFLKFSLLHRSLGEFDHPKTGGVVLALSTRVSDIVKPEHFPSLPQTWLTLPWVHLHRLPKGAKELPMLSLLNKRDLFGALVNSLVVTLRMRRHRHLSPWVLQTYTAFRWFILRRAIDKVSSELVMTDHFDRRAVLVDRAVRECRRSPDCKKSLILVQHGAMGSLDQDKDKSVHSLNLPTRLRQVDILYAYNSGEANAFKNNVFAFEYCSRPLEVHFFKPTIELAGEVISDHPRVLFVGHPLCESFHVSVFQRLNCWKNLEVSYKPHPKAPMSAAMAEVGWKILHDENIFPRVDLLVSYPSTLVIEYENCGIPSSVHPLNASSDFLTQILENIKKNLDKKI